MWHRLLFTILNSLIYIYNIVIEISSNSQISKNFAILNRTFNHRNLSLFTKHDRSPIEISIFPEHSIHNFKRPMIRDRA